MDARTLINLAPAMFRGPLLQLLDRLEAAEKRLAVLEASMNPKKD